MSEADDEASTLPVEEEEGSGKKKEPRGYKGWFFTWNNPKDTPEEFITKMKQLRSTMGKFQLEKCPTTGTPHFQGGAQWHWAMRGKTLTRSFPGIWIARLQDWNMCYGTKEDTRLDGPWAWGCVLPRPLLSIKPEELYPWQKVLFDRLSVPCTEDRKVQWVWERDGCRGKSSLVKTLRDALGEGSVLSLGGDAKDIYHAIRQVVKPMKGPQIYDLKVVVFDLERGDPVPYDSLGKIKDGWLFSPKYDSADLRFAPVHVVCLANFPPDEARISADRWEIIEL